MFKLLIADDNHIVIKKIKKSINWAELGIEVVGEVYNGVDALKNIGETNPHILITDIRMPVMDGIELLRRARQIKKSLKVIILSGHEDFVYAKQALELGAAEYILKTDSPKILEESLKKVLQKIKTEEAQELEKQRLIKENSEHIVTIKKQLLLNILENQIDIEQSVIEKLGQLDQTLVQNKIGVSVMEVDGTRQRPDIGSSGESKEYVLAIINFIENIMERKNLVFLLKISPIRIAIICFYNQTMSLNQIEEDFSWFISMIKNNINKQLALSITVAMGKTALNIKELRSSFLTAVYGLNNKLIYGKNRIINQHHVQKINQKNKAEFLRKEQDLLTIVESSEPEKIFMTMELFFKSVSEDKNCDFQDLINSCYKLILVAQKLLLASNADVKWEADYLSLEFLKEIETIDEMSEYIKNCFKRIFEVIGAKRANKYSRVIDFVLQYIEKNYMCSLSLNDLSKELYITPNYLTTLFKKETGVSFKKYLTDLRMKKAEELLADPKYKISEITAIIGYENEEYFCRLFKRYHGVTPTEYRNNIA